MNMFDYYLGTLNGGGGSGVNGLPVEEISDAAVATFDDGADDVPVKALSVAIVAVQDGAGDPAPDNVRAISGFAEAKIYVGAAYPTADDTYTVDLDGTRYGGTLNVAAGKLTVTHAAVDLSTLTWNAAAYGYNTTGIASLVKAPASNATPITGALCEQYVITSRTNVSNDTAGANRIGVGSNGNLLCSGSSEPAGLFVYPLATPVVVDLTPTDVKTLKGDNNIWSDCGNVTVQYRADVELYTDKRVNGLMDSFADRSLSGDIVLTNPANIGSYAFYGCENITSVTIKSDTMCELAGVSAFIGCTSLAHIYVPSELVLTYQSDATWSTYGGLIEAIP